MTDRPKKPYTFVRMNEQECTVLATDWEDALERLLDGEELIETRKAGPWERDEE